MVKLSADGPTISPARFCHIVLQTTTERYPAMVDWYLNFLGGRVVWGNNHLSFISYDDEHHRIGITGYAGAVPRVAFAYDNLGDLLIAYLQRRKKNIYPSWCVNHGPTTSIYYADPDGNEVETQVDNFDTNEEATTFMNGPEFTENPFGVDFVPEVLIQRLENGESEQLLAKRPCIGPRTGR